MTLSAVSARRGSTVTRAQNYPGPPDPHHGRLHAGQRDRHHRAHVRAEAQRSAGACRSRSRTCRAAAAASAASASRRRAPDGYTLYWGANGAMTINPSLLPNPSFDPQRDLAPIARLLVSPSILAVNNDVPAKTVAELIALAKSQPGKLSYASPGAGTPQHIAGEVFKSAARSRHRARSLSRRELHRRDRRAHHHDVPECRRDAARRCATASCAASR